MPTYNYKCKKCNFKFSLFQSIKDNSKVKCKKCNRIVKRIIGGNMGLVFKGSGFYLTDYVHKNKKNNTKEKKES